MTSIEWTDETWNPVVGCSIVSPGCTNCYAMKMAHRIGPNFPHYAGLTKLTKGGPVWTGKVATAPDSIFRQPLSWRKPRRIFVNSMSDLFHEDVTDATIDRVFAIMAICREHTFQVLTKRADRMRDYLSATARGWPPRRIDDALRTLALPPDDAVTALFEPPLRNVWLGVSTEDQRRAEERVPVLLDTPAAVRWVSAEPLLGPLRMDGWLRSKPSRTVLDWVVAGGESGPGARPAHPDWFRTIRDQCASAGVPFFFKQWGGWQTIYDRDGDDPDWRRCDSVKRKTPRGQWLNLAGGQGFHGERVLRVVPVSKARAGAELDGRLHREFPT